MFTQVDRSNRRVAGRPRHRADAGAQPRRHARRHASKRAATGPGTGSEFIVELPLLRERADAADRASRRRRKPLPPRRILVVDDNRDAAETPGRCCCARSAPTVALAHSGRAALDCRRHLQPGRRAARHRHARHGRLRSGAPHPRAAAASPTSLLIALTGWGQEDDRRRSRAAGFDHHLVKPPNIEKLRELLGSGWSRVERTH